MQLFHTSTATSAVFDDPNLVASAGLVPVLALADAAGLATLAGEHLSVPGDKGANAGLKVSSLWAGMVAGAGLLLFDLAVAFLASSVLLVIDAAVFTMVVGRFQRECIITRL